MIKEPPTSATSKAAYLRNRPPDCCDLADRNLSTNFSQASRTRPVVLAQQSPRKTARLATLRLEERHRAEAVEPAASTLVRRIVIRSPGQKARADHLVC